MYLLDILNEENIFKVDRFLFFMGVYVFELVFIYKESVLRLNVVKCYIYEIIFSLYRILWFINKCFYDRLMCYVDILL